MMLNLISPTHGINLFAMLGIYFLMFLAGYEEISIEELIRAMRFRLLVASVISFFVPFMLCFLIFYIFLINDYMLSIFLSSVMALTSLGVIIRLTSDMQVLRTRYGFRLAGMAVLNELIGLVLAGIALEFMLNGGGVNYLYVIARLPLFFLVAGLAGYFVIPKVIGVAERVFRVRAFPFAALIAMILMFSYVSLLAGLHGVMGALIVGFAMSRMRWDSIAMRTVDQLKGFAHGIFIPIFFANAGLYATREFLDVHGVIACSMAMTFIAGKMLAGYAITKVLSLSSHSPVIMAQLAKGGVEIALLSSALSMSLISVELYSFTIIFIITLTMISSLGLSICKAKGLFE